MYIEDNLSKKGETQDCKNSKVSKMSSGSVKINRNPMGKHTDSINENHSYGIRHDSCFLATIHKTKNSNFPYTSLNEEFINIGTLDRKDTKCLINNMKTPKSRPKSLSKPSTSDTNIKFIDQKLNDG